MWSDLTPLLTGYFGYHTGSRYLFVTWHELTVISFDPVELECDANDPRGGVSLALVVLNITVLQKVTVNNNGQILPTCKTRVCQASLRV